MITNSWVKQGKCQRAAYESTTTQARLCRKKRIKKTMKNLN